MIFINKNIMNPIQINLTNLRSSNLTVLMTVNNTTASTANVTGITINAPTSITAITDNTIYASNIDGGRLYFIDGPLTTNVPLPNKKGQYYGWIEFSQMPSDCPTPAGICQYWVNLSNVDITGMQLALTGTDINGTAFSVGYKSGATAMISALATAFPAAVVGTGKTKKILAPNHIPSAYPSYDTYLGKLTSTNAGMIIKSDDSIQFTGGFCNYFDTGITKTVVVLLTDTNGNTIKVTEESLTTDIIYQCDGGHIYYNNVQWPQNRGDGGATMITTNSVFRDICIGFNEGYWTPSKTVNNCNFPVMTPFTNGGSAYAQMVHSMSNSYGFPYADSNLMVLITALAGTNNPLGLTICDDKTPVGYSEVKSSNNAPACGTTTLGVGDSQLGVIGIGECTYSTTGGGLYGGYLPEMTGWTKMSFNVGDPSANPNGEPTYIWVNPNEISGKTGGIINTDCNGLPIISSMNGPICWSLAGTGYYCLTLPVASLLTGNGPCMPPPVPTPPASNFWTWLQKMWFNLLLWNKWTK
jgi:hypothetical protein